MKKLKFGIISPGEHFKKNITHVFSKIPSIEIKAIFSRKKKFNLFQDIKIYNNLNNFLNDKNIDVVYICSPNSLHFNHIFNSLKKNKHVICEKPLAMSLLNFYSLVRIAKRKKKFLFEGFMFQYHEQFQVLNNLIKNNKIGEIISINSSFCYPHRRKKDIRYNKIGGGAFLDVGCYLFKLSSLVFKKKPLKVIIEKYISKKYGVDTYGNCQLFYQKGVMANLEWGIGFKYTNYLQIVTTTDSLLLDRFFSKNYNKDYCIRIIKINGKKKVIKIKKMNHFTSMFNTYCSIIKNKNFLKYSRYHEELVRHQKLYLGIYSKYYK